MSEKEITEAHQPEDLAASLLVGATTGEVDRSTLLRPAKFLQDHGKILAHRRTKLGRIKSDENAAAENTEEEMPDAEADSDGENADISREERVHFEEHIEALVQECSIVKSERGEAWVETEKFKSKLKHREFELHAERDENRRLRELLAAKEENEGDLGKAMGNLKLQVDLQRQARQGQNRRAKKSNIALAYRPRS
jgi:hypothetical protein